MHEFNVGSEDDRRQLIPKCDIRIKGKVKGLKQKKHVKQSKHQ